MNRQQKRMMKKKGIDVPKTPTYNMNWDNLMKLREESRQEAYDEAVGTAITLLLSIPVKVVVEKYKWDMDDVQGFCDDLLDEYEKFDEGDMTLEDLQAFVYEHCGVKFERK